MKKLVFLSTATLISFGASAQRASTVETSPEGYAWHTRTHAVSGQAGFGWFAMIDDIDVVYADERGERDYRATLSGTPALTLAYDYRFGRAFSLGGAVGYQSAKLDEFVRTVNDGEVVTQEALVGSARFNRTFVSARTLFHYGRAANFEFYSGVRVGVTAWNVVGSGDVDDEGVMFGDYDGAGSFVLPHLNVIPFGVKGYVSPKVYVGAELMTGSPHVAAAQVGYRF